MRTLVSDDVVWFVLRKSLKQKLLDVYLEGTHKELFCKVSVLLVKLWPLCLGDFVIFIKGIFHVLIV